ncbi:hypothetical protein GCM10020220_093860 [Nonomuraea rubra]
MTSQEEGYIWPMSRVLKPPERGMTAAKKAASSLPESSRGPIVAGLRHSVIRNVRVPAARSNALTPTVMRVRTDQRRGYRQVRSSSKTTG